MKGRILSVTNIVPGNQLIIGTSQSDTFNIAKSNTEVAVFGENGDDLLNIKDNNTYTEFTGGDGTDTVSLPGNMDDYSAQFMDFAPGDPPVLRVIERKTGKPVAMLDLSMEIFKFADITVADTDIIPTLIAAHARDKAAAMNGG